jgi:sulfotransferase|tara:strand:+ start:481 stop:1299 length:819 start_codon:yes stop_codon:yes gene_type:complete
MDKLIFNCSLPRSGSELLQVILHQNPRIYASSTSPLLDLLFGASRNLGTAECISMGNDVVHKAFINGCKGMVKGWCESLTDRPVFLDKCRGWSHYYHWIQKFQSDPKILCMVRDIRCVVASFERAYQNNRFSPDCPDNPSALENLTLEERINYYLNSNPLNISLKRLDDVFQTGVSDKMLFIRHEDLCCYPEEVINKVYQYLKEEKYTHDFNNIKKRVKENSSAFGIFGNHSVKKSIEPITDRTWSDVLSDEVSSSLHNAMIVYQNRFGYTL